MFRIFWRHSNYCAQLHLNQQTQTTRLQTRKQNKFHSHTRCDEDLTADLQASLCSSVVVLFQPSSDEIIFSTLVYRVAELQSIDSSPGSLHTPHRRLRTTHAADYRRTKHYNDSLQGSKETTILSHIASQKHWWPHSSKAIQLSRSFTRHV